MADRDLSAALADLAGHPYILVTATGTPTERLSGPLPTAEVLDLGFGAADALVEVHARGLTVDRLHAGSLVKSASGEPRLAIGAVQVGESADQAADVSTLRSALAGLLAEDDDDPTTRATRTVLSDEPVQTAAALRDSLAAVRLGTLPPRPPIPSPDEVSPSATGGERVGGAVDAAQRLQARARSDGGPPAPAIPAVTSVWWIVLIGAVVVVVGVTVWLLVR